MPTSVYTDYRNHLLMQIELLRGGISHEELSDRLGSITERCLARYIAGKTSLLKDEFGKIAQALSIDAEMLARAWSSSMGLRLPRKNPVSRMLDRARYHWQRHSRLACHRVPPRPSPMVVLRAKYADRLPRETPPLGFHSSGNKKPTRKEHEQFARAYEMLVTFVHDQESQRTIGAMHGLSGSRARQLMQRATYAWARAEGIDIVYDRSVPFKADAKLVTNLYAGLRFFAQQQFDVLDAYDKHNKEEWMP
jgi:hypothetical protein